MKFKLSGWGWAVVCVALSGGAVPAAAQTGDDTLVLDASDAFRKRDGARLATLRDDAVARQHPLASWVDYWALNQRLADATPDDLDAFYTRWSGTYVEDRLRNDWLLELGRRGDWSTFRVDYPRFRMNDDRQVRCYALLAEHAAGAKVRDAARAEWFAQRDADAGCHRLAESLLAEREFRTDDVWQKIRVALEFGRTGAAKQAATLLGAPLARTAAQAIDHPARYLTRHASAGTRVQAEFAALAIARMAWSDAEAATGQLERRWQRQLPPDLGAWARTMTAKQSAQKLLPDAHRQFQHALALTRKSRPTIDWSDDTHAWRVRAALRAVDDPQRWQTVRQAIEAMSAAEQKNPTWVYWKARALLALAEHDADPRADELRLQGRAALLSIANPLHFYGQLAAEDLDLSLALPALPARPVRSTGRAGALTWVADGAARAVEPDPAVATPGAPDAEVPAPVPAAAASAAPAATDEVAAARAPPGLARAMRLIEIGLRNEGVREWNFSLRGMNDRQLIAAAAWACEREVWDRCINTSDRTRHEIHVGQRYPMPFRDALEGQARDAGLDPAYVFGLVRQESRFLVDARSHVGASGLMQVMPSTARWVANKIGLPYRPELIADRDVNLRLGTAYLRLVLDDFGGSQALAAAAYNAGPSRPRRWREGPLLETAIWAENIPFPETRDYVKKVLANAAVYAALLDAASETPSLKVRLGPGVGPRDATAPAPDRNLP